MVTAMRVVYPGHWDSASLGGELLSPVASWSDGLFSGWVPGTPATRWAWDLVGSKYSGADSADNSCGA